MQFVEHALDQLSAESTAWVNGISSLVLMTTFLMPLCVTVSWTAIEKRVQLFMSMLLVMETAMLVFAALDCAV